ncbi:hypothetical protein RQP46_008159 [Phenoliferia psychrophenolica]
MSTPTATSPPPQWLLDLRQNGYAVIKGAVPRHRADEYASAALDWVESFQALGFKRNDPKTWDAAHLPVHYPQGLFVHYSVTHEAFVWKARQEEGVLQAFTDLWGTDELICSFDAINISLPVGPHGRTDIPLTGRWPHQDQNPVKSEFELMQGLIAVTESGKEDGGLIVLKGTHKLHKQFFAETGGIKPEQDSGSRNYYTYTPADTDWFMAQPGVEEIKVESEAGDLVVWDSRTIHFNAAPTGDRTRVVVYVCMAPASYASASTLERKAQVFEQRLASTHWPHLNVIPVELGGPVLRDGKPDPHDRARPLHEPELTTRLLRMAGVEPYPSKVPVAVS